MRALRLPAPNTVSLMDSLHRPSPRLLVCSPAAETSARAWPVYSRLPVASWTGRTQDLPGSWGIHPVPLPCSRTPAGLAGLTLSAIPSAVPIGWTMKTPAIRVISRLSHTASVPAAYASSDALPHPHARLAYGRWLAFAVGESNPLDSTEWFPSPLQTSSIPRLILALPSATLSPSVHFPGSPVIGPTLLRRFRAGARRASPVA